MKKKLIIAGIGTVVAGVTNILFIRRVGKQKYYEGLVDGALAIASISCRQTETELEEKRERRGFFNLFNKD